MRITFMIGNGFDKKVGLKTGYDEFYKSLPQDSDNDIIKSIMADTMLWSDMEEQLGRYYDNEVSANQDIFIEQKHDLEMQLEEYLLSEQKRADYKKADDIATEMKRSIVDFYKSLSARDAEVMKSVKAKQAEPLRYSFIVFNYTDVFDKCISITRQVFKDVKHTSNNVMYTDLLDSIIHVHGMIGDGIVLGVNSVDQTQCQSLKEEDRVSNYLIKSRANDVYGELRTENTKRIIEESVIVCLFGLSMGITDKMWWAQLADWREKNNDRRLVVFTYDQGFRKDIYHKNRSIEDVLTKFQETSGCKETNWDQIKSRIYISPNPQIFNIKVC